MQKQSELDGLLLCICVETPSVKRGKTMAAGKKSLFKATQWHRFAPTSRLRGDIHYNHFKPFVSGSFKQQNECAFVQSHKFLFLASG